MSVMSFKVLTCVIVLLTLLCAPSFAQWQKISVETSADFRGLSIVGDKVIWVSGTKGTFVRSVDGGQRWAVGSVRGAETLDFRDVEAFDGDTAYLLSIGNGDASRIYKTTDGGRNWELQFKNQVPTAFFDAMAFWDRDHGIAVSDPVNGKFLILSTSNGGKNWSLLPSAAMPAAVQGEGAFAASGTCLIVRGKNDAWLVTGGTKARIFHSTDRGLNWNVMDSPLLSGIESAGNFSIAFRNQRQGIIVGGDYRQPESSAGNAALTKDGGKSWQALKGNAPSGFRSAASWHQHGSRSLLLVAGTSGSDLSVDDGLTWQSVDRQNYNAVRFSSSGVAWAAGPKGMIARYKPAFR
jgi:photosystem II stability/assembly factor-like uncharacterized protein